MLPQYSGGLGILAGDHLKARRDLGVPDRRRRPALPHRLLQAVAHPRRLAAGDATRCSTPTACRSPCCARPTAPRRRSPLALPGGRTLHAHVWRAQVGRVPLLLLDSDVRGQRRRRCATSPTGSTAAAASTGCSRRCCSASAASARCGCWSRLTGAPGAGGLPHQRGPRRLPRHRADPRARRAARPDASTRRSRPSAPATVFTTHTPVPAGIDRFGARPDQHVLRRRQRAAGRPGRAGARARRRGLRRRRARACSTWRSWACASAQRANGVSQLHGEVSREMFDGLWPGFDDAEVPITSITNGVHAPTWVDREVVRAGRPSTSAPSRSRTGDAAWERDRRRSPATRSGRPARRCASSSSSEARRRVRASWRQARREPRPSSAGSTTSSTPTCSPSASPAACPTYKRLTLMLRDPDRLKRAAARPRAARPARHRRQVAPGRRGRQAADPAAGAVRRRPRGPPPHRLPAQLRHRAWPSTLYPGCDVWLNNPLRPLEACGTSGMKAALNGGLNLSILDGWWDEWYDGENGWAIPTADGVEDPDRRDDLEAAALYDLIETTVAPRFYDRDDDGLPDALARDGAAHARPRSARRCSPPAWSATTSEQLYAPAAARRARRSTAATTPAPELAGVEGPGARGLAGVRVDHVESVGRRRRPRRSATAARARLRLARRPVARRRRGAGRARRGSRRPTTCATPQAAPLTLAETYEDGRHRFAGDRRPRPHRRRSATPCGSCRAPRAGQRRRAGPGRQRLTADARLPRSRREGPALSARLVRQALSLRAAVRSGPGGVHPQGPRPGVVDPGRAATPRGAAARRRCPRAASYAAEPSAARQRDRRVRGAAVAGRRNSERRLAARSPSQQCLRACRRVRAVPPAVVHRLAVGGEPREVGAPPSVTGPPGEEVPLAQHRVRRAAGAAGAAWSRAGRRVPSSQVPVEPRDLVVLAVGVVVAAAGCGRTRRRR